MTSRRSATAFALHLRKRPDGLGDGYTPVDGVGLVEVDGFEAKQAEALLQLRPQLGGRSVREPRPTAVALEATLRRDDQIVDVPAAPA